MNGCSGLRGSGSELPAGHAEIEIVDANDLEVHIAARSMDQMIATDGGQVAIPAEHAHHQLGFGQLDAGGKGDGTPVGGVIGVQVHVTCNASRAADTGNDNVPVHFDP